mmetsp:Transcript_6067/g.7433  ORF Transcript_6067/g.7433 Transcript_6067/m.7433 type:complete len:786 (+) Transcript_6067:199-2556(+)
MLKAMNDLNLDDYVDITDQFFESIRTIHDNKVVQSPLFNLLEGTRAVEIGNKKLDTGLIPLSEIDYSFDTSCPQNVDKVIGIINGLVRLYTSWLNNSSLPVTVMSCRYVQTLLENYQGSLNDCTFENKRLPKQENYDKSSVEWRLVHKVLNSFILGLVKFIGISLHIAFNTLYEEEDLTTRNMDLDFLTDIPSEFIVKKINESIHWLNQENGIERQKKEILCEYLELMNRMLDSQLILTIAIPIFENDDKKKIKNEIQFLQLGLKNIEGLSKVNFDSFKPPCGSFSKFIQFDSNNRSIPAELYMTTNEECFQSLQMMLKSIYNYVIESNELLNVNHFNQFLTYDISYKINSEYNAISRGLFQLYLIRDDKSILGSKETITSMGMKLMENTSCLQSLIFQPDTWTSIQGTDEHINTTKEDILIKLNQLLSDIETGIYHNLSSVTNNRCRQRQLMSRGIVIWDTLQVSSESLELELWQKYGIGDRIEGPDSIRDEPSLPLSSFVYLTKLNVMLEVALSGFETNIYKPFEMSWMYWYISYLTQVIAEFYSNQIKSINNLKIYSITTSVPKKIKKLKSGPKKQKLKQQNEIQQKIHLPMLEKINDYNNSYVIESYKGLRMLSDGVRMLFIMLHALEVTNITPSFELTSLEKIYNLQMKPWSSVGVPNLPHFRQYEKSIGIDFLSKLPHPQKLDKIKQILETIIDKFNDSKIVYISISKTIEDDEGEQFIGDGITEWYKALIKTCVMYSLEVNNIKKLIESGFNKDDYNLEIGEGYHRYFPKIFIKLIRQ